MWPQPYAVILRSDPANSAVELPIRDSATDERQPPIAFEEPEQPKLLEITAEATSEPRPERRALGDVAEGEWPLEVDPNYGGTRGYPDGLYFTEDVVERYWINENDPFSARTQSAWTIGSNVPSDTGTYP